MEKTFAKINITTNEVIEIQLSTLEYLSENYGGEWIEIKEYHNQPYPNYIWNSEIDNFHTKKPFPNWLLNSETAEWEPPIPKPNDDQDRMWSEEHQKWIPFCPGPVRTRTEPIELPQEKKDDEYMYEYNFTSNSWERVKYDYDLENDTWIRYLP